MALLYMLKINKARQTIMAGSNIKYRCCPTDEYDSESFCTGLFCAPCVESCMADTGTLKWPTPMCVIYTALSAITGPVGQVLVSYLGVRKSDQFRVIKADGTVTNPKPMTTCGAVFCPMCYCTPCVQYEAMKKEAVLSTPFI